MDLMLEHSNAKETITSLEMVEQINFFREREGVPTELKHYDLLKIIRSEFSEEIGDGKISVSSYKNAQNKEQPMFILTFNQAKQLLARESKSVRKAVFAYIEKLEDAWNSPEMVMSRALQIQNQLLNDYSNKINNLELTIQEQAPKVLFANAVASSDTCILVGDLAKLITQNGVKIGQNRLFEWLRYNGYLIKHGNSYNMPTQRAMELKLFEVKERAINNPDGSVRVTKTIKVTGKGQQYFINKFLHKEVAV